MTLQNTFGSTPTGGTMPGGVSSALDPLSQEAISQSASVGGSTYGAAGLNYAQRAQIAKTGGLTSSVDAYGGSGNSLIDFLLGRK